jgi:hypothetical protein
VPGKSRQLRAKVGLYREAGASHWRKVAHRMHDTRAAGCRAAPDKRRREKNMDTRPFEDLARKLAETVPPGVRALQADMEKNFRALLEASFSKMNLVTREEFEIQQRVLERTREKLAELEVRIQALQDNRPAGGA